MEIKTPVIVNVIEDVSCDVCRSGTSIPGYGLQYGKLEMKWGYGTQHDGERYKVHFCESCSFRVLSGLRRECMVHSIFDEDQSFSEERFGLISTGNYWGEESR